MTRQHIQDAQVMVEDYLMYGIDHIDKISHDGPIPIDIEVIEIAASLLQSDHVFADWAFVSCMTISNQQAL